MRKINSAERQESQSYMHLEIFFLNSKTSITERNNTYTHNYNWEKKSTFLSVIDRANRQHQQDITTIKPVGG